MPDESPRKDHQPDRLKSAPGMSRTHKVKRGRSNGPGNHTRLRLQLYRLSIRLFSDLRLHDLSRFTKQLATLNAAGVSIPHTLDLLAQQTENQAILAALRDVYNDLKKETTLAGALAKHPHVFDPLYCTVVAGGEADNTLPQNLARLGEYLERRMAMGRKMKKIVYYPLALLLLAGIGISSLILFVVPKFGAVFAETQIPLPLVTEIVLKTASFAQDYGIAFIALAAIALAFGVRMSRSPGSALIIDRFLLRIPFWGTMRRKRAMCAVCHSLGMLTNRVNPVDAIAIASGSAASSSVRNRLLSAMTNKSADRTLNGMISSSEQFPAAVTLAIKQAEQQGQTARVCTSIALFYEEEIDAEIDAFLAVLEPAVVLIAGLVVALILGAMYLPLVHVIFS